MLFRDWTLLRMEQFAETRNPHQRQRTLPDHRNGNPRQPRAAKRNLDRRRDFYSALGREALRPLKLLVLVWRAAKCPIWPLR